MIHPKFQRTTGKCRISREEAQIIIPVIREINEQKSDIKKISINHMDKNFL